MVALKYMLLAMIDIMPRTGYELGKLFDHILSNFWTADQRQVYHALDKLESDGWITAERIIQESAPNKNVYSITPTGKEALRSWLTTPQPPQPTRQEWLAQVFFGGLVEPEALEALIDGRKASLEARASDLERHLADYQRVLENPPPRDWGWMFALRMMMFRYVRAQHQAERRWLEEVRVVLELLKTLPPDDLLLAKRLLKELLQCGEE
ncbi:MAG: PadR family transcriptional regulator [Chloroflexi bacterium]|nr:PadR family transcriptional regulator [Chloroflexota bacterium]